MREPTWSAGTYMAEFRSADELNGAVRALTTKGYTRLETYSPVPIDAGIQRGYSKLPLAVFIAGLLGGIGLFFFAMGLLSFAFLPEHPGYAG